MPSLIEIDPKVLVLEKKIFKFCQCIFTILELSPIGKMRVPSFKKLEMLCAKSDRNWPSDSGEDENVKSL